MILTWCNQYTQKKDKRKALFSQVHSQRTHLYLVSEEQAEPAERYKTKNFWFRQVFSTKTLVQKFSITIHPTHENDRARAHRYAPFHQMNCSATYPA